MMVFASITPAVSGEIHALFRKKEEEKEEEFMSRPCRSALYVHAGRLVSGV